MVAHHDIQACIQDCERIANQLRQVANQVNDQRARFMLTEAASHVEMCVSGCDMAKMMVGQQQGAQQFATRY